MADNTSAGTSLIVAALILGLAIVAGAFVVKGSLDAGVAELAEVRTALDDVQSAIESAGAPAPTRQAAARPRRPDPRKRYDIDVGPSPARGPKNAPVTIVEWSDFQCPFCRRVGPTLDQIEKEYGDQVRIAFKHYPLSIHPKAPAAHAAAEAAHQQGKFWEMHDKIFANQAQMSPEKYEEYAQELGLDLAKFRKDRDSAQTKARVDGDAKAASGLGVTGTPAFFVNGRFLNGAQPFGSFKRLIDEELKKQG